MIIIDTPQGSAEWLEARYWRLTGSALKSNITTTGKLSSSETATEAIDKLIAGLQLVNDMRANPEKVNNLDDYEFQKFVSTYTGEKFTGNKHTERGKELEPDAIAALSAKIGKAITEVGLCVMGDSPNGVVSCSPDGLIYDDKKLVSGVELKAPCYCTFLGYVAGRILPSQYKLQVHSSMAICEVDHWHFAAYWPGRPLFYLRVNRDKFTDTLESSLNEFRGAYQDRYQEVTAALEQLESANVIQTQP